MPGRRRTGRTPSVGARSEAAHPDEAPSDDVRSDDHHSDDHHSDDARSGDARSGDVRSGDVRSGDVRSDEARSDEARSDDARSDDHHSDDARSGDVRSGDVRSGEARSDDARSDDHHSDDAHLHGAGPRGSRRAEARPERSALALVPVPGWLPELLGGEVTRAAAWRAGPAVYLRVATPRGPELLELLDRRGQPIRGHRIEPGGAPPRRPLPELASLDAAGRRAVRRFVRRFAWMHAPEGDAPAAYASGAREARARALARALARLRSPEDAATVPRPHEDEPDPLLRAVALYVDTVAGRWDRVFAALDRRNAPPDWLAPLLVGLGGDAEALRRLAEGAAARGEPLDVAAALAFERARFFAAAERAYASAVGGLAGPIRADLCVRLARQLRARGRDADAASWARRALLIRGDDDRLLRRACFELVRCGALDDAYAALWERGAREPPSPAVALDLAELLLWAGRADEARPWVRAALRARPDDPTALRCLGVLHALEERWAEAREAFERAHERAPRDMEIGTWLSEVHLRLGDRAAAERWLVEARAAAQTAAHMVLEAELYGSHHVHALLAALGEPEAPWRGDPETRREAALSLLSSFGGNRGERLTRPTRARDGDGGLGLEIVRLPEDDAVLASREASAETLKLLGTIPLAELEARFDALAQHYPESPHPLCYRGELDLWLGAYERAIGRFEAALERAEARWAYVGRAAAHLLRGEPEAADRALAELARAFEPVIGATTHVYVGEALRRRGEHEAAIEELSGAVRVKPGRTGAWMNLALAHRALGRRAEAERIFHRLARRHPRLYWDAWRALGRAPRWPLSAAHLPELFEKALEMMRGNRSSHTVTYFDADGVFRIARDAEAWRTAMAQHASFLALGLQSRLAAGAFADAPDE